MYCFHRMEGQLPLWVSFKFNKQFIMVNFTPKIRLHTTLSINILSTLIKTSKNSLYPMNFISCDVFYQLLPLFSDKLPCFDAVILLEWGYTYIIKNSRMKPWLIDLTSPGGVIAFRSSLNNLYWLFALLSKKNSFQIYLYSEHIWFCLKGGKGA